MIIFQKRLTDIYVLDIYFCSMFCTQGRRTMLLFARLDLCQQVVARVSSFVFRHFKVNIGLLRIVSFVSSLHINSYDTAGLCISSYHNFEHFLSLQRYDTRICNKSISTFMEMQLSTTGTSNTIIFYKQLIISLCDFNLSQLITVNKLATY